MDEALGWMKSPTADQVDRAAATIVDIARTEGLEEGVVVFHPRGLTTPRWHPRDDFEAPLSEVWVPVPTATGVGDRDLHAVCRRKVEIAIEYRQHELRRMMRELQVEGSHDAERKVSELLYDSRVGSA
ncbi:MAG: hypothetical protein H0T15_03940 [Thermoleophilaceae bacterium]|nr:hypothetical protein [Thermoleophilaceae bacterium]